MHGNGLVPKCLKILNDVGDFQLSNIMKELIKYFSEKQKTLFLIDSLGAFMTSFSLVVFVREFNEYFGIPKKELAYLSAIAVIFCLYSAVCFLFLKRDLKPFIRYIGIANLLYCTLTILLLIQYYSLLTILGSIYFLIEIVIICGLSFVELKVAAINK